MTTNNIEEWNKIAKEYSKNQKTATNSLINWQIIKDVLGKVENKKILDAGCGDGFFTNELYTKNADICGFDGSEKLIKIAKSEHPNIDFCTADLTKEFPYNNNCFDIVISSLTLMGIDNVNEFFKQANRVLKLNGKLVFTIVHPCFFHLGIEESSATNKKINNYYSPSTKTIKFWGETTHFHRPISFYSKLLKENGFVIEEIVENPHDTSWIPSNLKKIPVYICFSCVKQKNIKWYLVSFKHI